MLELSHLAAVFFDLCIVGSIADVILLFGFMECQSYFLQIYDLLLYGIQLCMVSVGKNCTAAFGHGIYHIVRIADQ